MKYPTYKLGQICIIERGGSPRPIKNYLTNADDGINWIKIGDATLSNKYIYKTAEKIKPEGLSKTRKVEYGDLILSNSMSFGRPYIMRTSGCIHDGWVVFRLNKEIIDEEYLYTILTSNEVYAQFNHLATGSTVKNLNIDRIKEVVIPLPSLSTQHQIVSRIETLFAELDKAEERLRTAQQQIKTYRQAVLNHWLNNDDRKWEMVKLGDVADAIDPEPSHRTPKIQRNGIPFVSIKDCDYITNTINLETARLVSKNVLSEHKERYSIKEGDFIIGKIGTIGNPVNVILPQEYALSANVVLIQPTSKINAKFLYNTFRSNVVEKQLFDGKKATTQAAFGIKKVRLIEIPLPPLSEQQRIVAEIESRLSQAEASSAYIENALQQAEALRQSILKKAFSGELVASTGSATNEANSATKEAMPEPVEGGAKKPTNHTVPEPVEGTVAKTTKGTTVASTRSATKLRNKDL